MGLSRLDRIVSRLVSPLFDRFDLLKTFRLDSCDFDDTGTIMIKPTLNREAHEAHRGTRSAFAWVVRASICNKTINERITFIQLSSQVLCQLSYRNFELILQWSEKKLVVVSVGEGAQKLVV